MTDITIIREGLYRDVWKMPITHIAKKHGVSDTLIIRICKIMEIPRPAVGHWSKKAYGKNVKEVPLPPPMDSTITEYTIVNAGSNSGKSISEISNDTLKEYSVNVNEDSNLLHPLAKKTLKLLKRSKPGDRGVISVFDKPHLDLRVTKGTLERATFIISALLHLFDNKGWTLKKENMTTLEMNVIVNGESISFYIKELIKRVDHVLTVRETAKKARGEFVWHGRYDYHPTGDLLIKIETSVYLTNRHTFKDGKRNRLEDLLSLFCSELPRLADKIKEQRAKRKADDERYEIKRKKSLELKARREVEIEKRQKLEDECDQWVRAKILREYIDAMKGKGGENVSKEWVMWAANYADLLDPTTEGDNTVVEETDGMHFSIY